MDENGSRTNPAPVPLSVPVLAGRAIQPLGQRRSVRAGAHARALIGVTDLSRATVDVLLARLRSEAIRWHDNVHANLSRSLVQAALADRGVATGEPQVVARRVHSGRHNWRHDNIDLLFFFFFFFLASTAAMLSPRPVSAPAAMPLRLRRDKRAFSPCVQRSKFSASTVTLSTLVLAIHHLARCGREHDPDMAPPPDQRLVVYQSHLLWRATDGL